MPFVPGGVLFSGNPIAGVLRRQIDQMCEEVLQTGPDVILAYPQETIVDGLVERYKLALPNLDINNATKDVFETHVPEHWPLELNARFGGRFVLGTVYNLEIPYTGHKSFFYVQPSSGPMGRPRGFEQNGKLIIPIAGGERMTSERVTQHFQTEASLTQEIIEILKAEAEAHAPTFLAAARTAVSTRAAKLKRDIETSAAIPFPLKERPGAPSTYIAPTVRRRAVPELQRSPGIEAHPTLAEEHYQHILSVIDQMTAVMEHSPKAFATMKEEDIRFHYLVQLNGHYLGNATGETFNLEGKTDITIRDNSVVLFIAELKFWEGPKSLTEALDQILGYVAWRDTKAALIMFSRNKDFTATVAAARAQIVKHPNCKSGPTVESTSRSRYIFTNRDDRDREFSLTLLLFNIRGSE